MIDHGPDEEAKLHFRGRAALWAGLAAGLIFVFLSRGIPWSSMGFGTSAMGRELPIREVPTLFFVNAIVHFALAIVYSFVIGRLVYRFDMPVAVALGAVVGLFLYGLNYLLFVIGLGLHGPSEFSVAATHFFFGMVVAGAYKALSVPKVRIGRTV
jgi:hypothetical protein